MNHHRAYTDDTTNRETTRVTQEDLRRETVPPEVTDQCSDEGSKEDYQFFGPRDVHHIKVLRPHKTTACVGEDEQGDTHDGGVAGTHTVHTVVEVCSVADGGYDDDGEDHKEDPTEAVFVVLSRPGE